MNIGLDPRRAPWEIEALDFPLQDGLQERIEFLLRYAILAPSSHNAQPWSFALEPHAATIHLDRSKSLPIVDPEHREAILSIGAAIMNLRVAAAHFETPCHVRYLPEPAAPDLLARITVPAEGYTDPQLAQLFPAIQRRRTNRAAFDTRSVDGSVLQALHWYAAGCTTAIRLVTERDLKADVGALVARADRLQFADPAFRIELSAWLRSSWTQSGDGMPADAFGIPDVVSPAGPWLTRTFDLGGTQGRNHDRLAREAPLLAVVCGENTVASWLEAGEMLERFILAATVRGLQYAFMNAPIEVPELRRELRDALQVPLYPQLVLRLGYARPVRRGTPRRGLDDVLRR